MKIAHDILEKELYGDPHELRLSMEKGDIEDVEYRIEHLYYKHMGFLRDVFRWACKVKSYKVVHTLFHTYGMRLHDEYHMKIVSMKSIPKGCSKLDPDRDLVYRSMRIIHLLLDHDGYLALLEKQSVIYPPRYGYYKLFKVMLRYDKIDTQSTERLALKYSDQKLLSILADYGCTCIYKTHIRFHGGPQHFS